MSRRGARGSSSIGALALLLVVLVAGVGWNYHRNVAREQAEFRPYRGYSDADLAALVAAYEQESKTSGQHLGMRQGQDGTQGAEFRRRAPTPGLLPVPRLTLVHAPAHGADDERGSRALAGVQVGVGQRFVGGGKG